MPVVMRVGILGGLLLVPILLLMLLFVPVIIVVAVAVVAVWALASLITGKRKHRTKSEVIDARYRIK
jgi:hypothetical protein